MGDRDPENVKELVRQLLPFSRTPQVLDKLLDYSRTTKLDDIPDTPEFVKNSGLGELTVGDLIDLLGKVPIYYPNTPLSSYVKKTLNKAAIEGKLTAQCAKQLAKKAGEILREQAIQKMFQEVAKENALRQAGMSILLRNKETTQQIVEQALKVGKENIAQQAAKEMAEETAKQGAKRAAFACGAAVEAVTFTASMVSTARKYERGEISKEAFRRHAMKRGGAACGSLYASTVGASIGTAVIPIPVLGAVIGGALGGFLGDYFGSKLGQEVDEILFF